MVSSVSNASTLLHAPQKIINLQATRDYNIGEGPEPAVAAVAEELGICLPIDFSAQLFDHERDIVAYDVVLVMDKYTAADVLREVN